MSLWKKTLANILRIQIKQKTLTNHQFILTNVNSTASTNMCKFALTNTFYLLAIYKQKSLLYSFRLLFVFILA